MNYYVPLGLRGDMRRGELNGWLDGEGCPQGLWAWGRVI